MALDYTFGFGAMRLHAVPVVELLLTFFVDYEGHLLETSLSLLVVSESTKESIEVPVIRPDSLVLHQRLQGSFESLERDSLVTCSLEFVFQIGLQLLLIHCFADIT